MPAVVIFNFYKMCVCVCNCGTLPLSRQTRFLFIFRLSSVFVCSVNRKSYYFQIQPHIYKHELTTELTIFEQRINAQKRSKSFSAN